MISSTRWRKTVPNTLKCVRRSTFLFYRWKHRWVHFAFWMNYLHIYDLALHLCYLLRCSPVRSQKPSRKSTTSTVRSKIRLWSNWPIRLSHSVPRWTNTLECDIRSTVKHELSQFTHAEITPDVHTDMSYTSLQRFRAQLWKKVGRTGG